MTVGIAPLEVKALAKIIDELSYYQILHLEPDASRGDLKRAYYATSRTFHPDANGHLADEVRENCVLISKRITEAYCVLQATHASARPTTSGWAWARDCACSSPRPRRPTPSSDTESRQGKTAQGRQFLQKAREDMGQRRLRVCRPATSRWP